MRLPLLLIVTCVQFAAAQKPAITIENFNIHQAKANADGEDLDSKFPIVHTGNNASDAKINNLLQTRFFGRLLDEKAKASVRQDFTPIGDQVFDYTTQINERFVGIVIKQYHTINTMSLNGYNENFPFIFDPRSGQQVSPLTFFSEDGVLLFLGKAFHGFRESYNQTMDRYLEGFSKLKAKAQAETCDCECEPVLLDAFRNNLVTFNFSKESLELDMDACSWQNPGPHDVYSFSIAMSDVRPLLSDYGKYMIDGGPEVDLPTSPYTLFEGTVGDAINMTFVLHQTNGTLSGYEIYNRIGTLIKLSGTVKGAQYTFDELTPEGTSLATFKAILDGATMTGTWTKKDLSRSLSFSAVKY